MMSPEGGAAATRPNRNLLAVSGERNYICLGLSLYCKGTGEAPSHELGPLDHAETQQK